MSVVVILVSLAATFLTFKASFDRYRSRMDVEVRDVI